jgi:hypothetical protein
MTKTCFLILIFTLHIKKQDPTANFLKLYVRVVISIHFMQNGDENRLKIRSDKSIIFSKNGGGDQRGNDEWRDGGDQWSEGERHGGGNQRNEGGQLSGADQRGEDERFRFERARQGL